MPPDPKKLADRRTRARDLAAQHRREAGRRLLKPPIRPDELDERPDQADASSSSCLPRRSPAALHCT
jgi:hypothetical protein